MLFTQLGLSSDILRAVEERGYKEPTPVQAQAIPAILDGRDMLAGAQTGTGKTAAFTLPILQRLIDKPVGRSRKVRALVLTPTRELAAQVVDSVNLYSKYLPIKSAVIFGGVKIGPQISRLRGGVDVLVATPGRLLDHVSQNTVDLSEVEIIALDEADRMLDMGFIHDIKKILARMPSTRQNLMFSATYSNEIKNLTRQFLNSPVEVEVARQNTATETVVQKVHLVDGHRKRELLSQMIKADDWQQVLVFTRTKHGANRLVQQLELDGITAAAIHGNKSQSQRTRALADFKRNKVRVLVATDIAARGIDINLLPHVVNFELPNQAEDYVHRIGRTGRAGSSGEALSLVCIDEHRLLCDIERLIKDEIPKIALPGFDPDPSIAAKPIQNGRNNSNRGGQRQHSRKSGSGNAQQRSSRQHARRTS